VADGVGGGKGGEEASSRTLDTIVRYVAGSSLFFSNLDKEGQHALLHDLTLSVQWSPPMQPPRSGLRSSRKFPARRMSD